MCGEHIQRDKTCRQVSLYWSIFQKSRHLGFGVFIDIWSMLITFSTLIRNVYVVSCLMMESLEMSLSLSPSCLNFHTEFPHLYRRRDNKRGVTERCRLSWLTNSALVYESKCGGMGGGVIAGSQPMSTAVHKEPK